MKKVFFLACALVSMSMSAQDSPWTHNGLTGVNFSQTSFTNWSEGGENQIATNAYFNGSLNYKQGKASWTNDLSANYGLNFTDANGWRKNIDNLNFASKFGHQITEKVYYAVLLDIKSQMGYGYKYSDSSRELISKFMTPGYANLSVGIDYKPNSNVAIYFSPVAGKMTVVSDTLFSKRYGVDEGKYLRPQLGSIFKATANYSLFQDKVTVKSALDLFTAYDESFGNIDVNWDMIIGYNLSKLMTLTFQSTLKYDDDIKTLDANKNVIGGAKVQFKEMLGLGISYKF